jgi:UDP-glucose 4-epimerase
MAAKPKRTSTLEPHASRVPQRDERVVALTGASSFLGRNLVGLLEEDPSIDRIVALDLRPPTAAAKKTRFYEVDLTQPGTEARLAEIFAAERARTLVHLAFYSSPSHATAYAHELESVGTMHVLVAARQARVRKVVMRSSTLLYGAHPTNPNFLGEHHPLRASKREPFFADKVEAEEEAMRFVERSEGAVATVLRTAPILGPTVTNYVTRYLSGGVVLTMMGFDPLVQFVHELDAIAAFKLAIDRDAPGTFNIVGDGVLPLSAVVAKAGRVAVPVPHPIAEPLVALAWMAQVAPAPPAFLRYLRFLCVADGARARDVMGFRPAYTTREALADFVHAQGLRETNLLQPTAAQSLTPPR